MRSVNLDALRLRLFPSPPEFAPPVPVPCLLVLQVRYVSSSANARDTKGTLPPPAQSVVQYSQQQRASDFSHFPLCVGFSQNLGAAIMSSLCWISLATPLWHVRSATVRRRAWGDWVTYFPTSALPCKLILYVEVTRLFPPRMPLLCI